jgi:hypothetical protein
MNNAKYALTIMLFVSITPFFAIADAVYYRVKEGYTGYYWAINIFQMSMDNYTGIMSNESVGRGRTFTCDTMSLYFDNKEIKMFTEVLESVNKKDVFAVDLVRNRDNPEQKIWIPAYYLDALLHADKNIIYQNEKKHLDHYLKIEYGEDVPWEQAYRFDEGLEIYQNGLALGGVYVFIDNVVKTTSGYIVTTWVDEGITTWTKYFLLPWPLVERPKYITFIFEFDGDYLTIYLENTNSFFTKMVRVDAKIEKLIENLVWEEYDKQEIFDFLQTVSWPRRADGSMDYSPPQLARAIPEQPETVAVNTLPTADEDVATVTPATETVAQQPGIGLPLIIVLAAAE